MTNKELRKLGRRELLEMLISQTKELNRVKRELDDAHNALNDRRILLAESGSIAEAALKLNKVFEAAQEAADQYLENIRQSRSDDDFTGMLAFDTAEASNQDLLEKTRRECEAMRAKAEAECKAMREETQKECEEMIAKAQEQSRNLDFESLFRDLQIKE